MLYAIDKATNNIVGSFESVPLGFIENYPTDYPTEFLTTSDLFIGREFNKFVYSQEQAKIIPRPIPIKLKVNREDINQFRDKLDESPVNMDGHIFDADLISLRKMGDVASFVSDSQNVTWTLADNSSYTFIGATFKTLVNRVKIGQTKRSYALHLHAKALKNKLPNVTDDDLDESLWPMDTIF